MSLERFLSEKRSSILTKWRNLIIGSYPADAQRFLRKEKNRFSNPVGQSISADVEILCDALTTGEDSDKLSSSLDGIIRIRAVQDFKPSQAVGFVLQLKKIIRFELAMNRQDEAELKDELEALEDRIENAALLAFDIYSQCRQKLYEIRVNETKNQVGRLLERANLTVEIPDLEPDLTKR
jgi:hypothetical protein